MANEVTTTEKKVPMIAYLGNEAVKANITNAIGEKDTQAFISSLVSAVTTNPELAKCTNSSLLSAALLGHSLKLPQSPQLGMFFFVPYKGKNGATEAQFQISYRGLLNLAQRSGQYKKIHVTDIREGELKSYDPIEDTYEFEAVKDMAQRLKLPVVGYYGYYELLNGYRETLYWSREKMEAHAKKYSASYRNGWSSSIWKTDFDKMAYKTLIRQLISKGPMSVEMNKAYVGDQAVLDENMQPHYVDNVADEPTKFADVVGEVEAGSVTEITEGEDGTVE